MPERDGHPRGGEQRPGPGDEHGGACTGAADDERDGTTADGVAEGVASVVSHAIDWAPHDWKADVDDVLQIARVGRKLLFDSHAALEGYQALQAYVADGLRAYREYLVIR